MPFYGPWISLPVRTSTVANVELPPTPVLCSEDSSELTAAQMQTPHLRTPLVDDNAVLAGARAPSGTTVYNYQQWEGNPYWTATDVTPTDAFDPLASSQEVDTSTFTTAVTAVDVTATVMPAVVGDTSDLTSSSVRVAFGFTYQVPRVDPLGLTLHDIYTGPTPQGERTYAAGAGDITLAGMTPSDFSLSLSGLEFTAFVLAYVDRNDTPPLTLTPTSGDHYVYWTLALATTITYTPLRFRNVYDFPPPQRQFPRDDGLGISTRRSWPPVTSTQFGLRRGASGTYQ